MVSLKDILHIHFNTSYPMVFQVVMYMHLIILIIEQLWLCVGVFHAKYEDTGSGRIWQGVTKYVIGALLEFPETPPEHKVLVSQHSSICHYVVIRERHL